MDEWMTDILLFTWSALEQFYLVLHHYFIPSDVIRHTLFSTECFCLVDLAHSNFLLIETASES